MLDRDNAVFHIPDLSFWKRKNLNQPLQQTLVDGEMIIDQVDGKPVPRYLIYDIIKFEVTESIIYLFGVLRRFQHCTGHITTGSWKGRGNQYIQFARVLHCKLPTNGKQLPAFPLQAVTGIEPRPQRWEVRVLPLCHRGPQRVSCQEFKLLCFHCNTSGTKICSLQLTPFILLRISNFLLG